MLMIVILIIIQILANFFLLSYMRTSIYGYLPRNFNSGVFNYDFSMPRVSTKAEGEKNLGKQLINKMGKKIHLRAIYQRVDTSYDHDRVKYRYTVYLNGKRKLINFYIYVETG